MSLPHKIIQLLSEKAGYDVTTPTGAYYLSLDIETKTKVLLARNTVGRLTGVIRSNHVPRIRTLNAIADFLGYTNWERFLSENPTLKECATTLDKNAPNESSLCRKIDWDGMYSFEYAINEQGILSIRKIS